MVEHSTQNPKIKALNPATVIWRESGKIFVNLKL